MRLSIKLLLILPLLIVGTNGALAFSFGSDDDDDWWRYSYYGNPNQPWIAPNGMMYYPRMPYFERSRMVDQRQWQMEQKRRAMQELGDMLYGQNGFDRTRAILEAAAARGDLPEDIDVEQMAEDLVSPIFFRGLIRRIPLDRKWLENHVDRLLNLYGA